MTCGEIDLSPLAWVAFWGFLFLGFAWVRVTRIKTKNWDNMA